MTSPSNMTAFESELQCALLRAIEDQANRTAAALERVLSLQSQMQKITK